MFGQLNFHPFKVLITCNLRPFLGIPPSQSLSGGGIEAEFPPSENAFSILTKPPKAKKCKIQSQKNHDQNTQKTVHVHYANAVRSGSDVAHFARSAQPIERGAPATRIASQRNWQRRERRRSTAESSGRSKRLCVVNRDAV